VDSDVLDSVAVAREPGLDGWTFDADRLVASFGGRSFSSAGGLVAAIAAAADLADHHPDLELHYPGRVSVVLTSHDAGGVTIRDVELARSVSRLADDFGATTDDDRP
jgi:4a-hydroxytetrahydrobiopterin dehydratase